MATVNWTSADADGMGCAVLFTWALTTANADGQPVGGGVVQHADMCWQAVGTSWGTATAAMQGSNDNVNWFPLTNVSGGAAATFTADGGKQTNERPLYLRPNLTTPGTAAVVTITLLARRNPLR